MTARAYLQLGLITALGVAGCGDLETPAEAPARPPAAKADTNPGQASCRATGAGWIECSVGNASTWDQANDNLSITLWNLPLGAELQQGVLERAWAFNRDLAAALSAELPAPPAPEPEPLPWWDPHGWFGGGDGDDTTAAPVASVAPLRGVLQYGWQEPPYALWRYQYRIVSGRPRALGPGDGPAMCDDADGADEDPRAYDGDDAPQIYQALDPWHLIGTVEGHSDHYGFFDDTSLGSAASPERRALALELILRRQIGFALWQQANPCTAHEDWRSCLAAGQCAWGADDEVCVFVGEVSAQSVASRLAATDPCGRLPGGELCAAAASGPLPLDAQHPLRAAVCGR